MHTRLVSYLQDNRDQIIENWLTEAEIPAPAGSPIGASGVVPYEFFTTAFDAVLELIEQGPDGKRQTEILHLDRFLGITGECRARCAGGRICIELHEAGLHAFMGVFAEEWDAEHEFNELDRDCSKDLINHALSGIFDREIERCPEKSKRNDCPFVAHQTQPL